MRSHTPYICSPAPLTWIFLNFSNHMRRYRTCPTDLKRSLTPNFSPSFTSCFVRASQTPGAVPLRGPRSSVSANGARRDGMASGVTVQEVLWQPSWIRVRCRRHRQLRDAAALAASCLPHAVTGIDPPRVAFRDRLEGAIEGLGKEIRRRRDR